MPSLFGKLVLLFLNCFARKRHYVVILQVSDPIVRIDNGLVRGQLNATVDAEIPYYAFRGIPYAKPPIGDFRFRVRPKKQNFEKRETEKKRIRIKILHK